MTRVMVAAIEREGPEHHFYFFDTNDFVELVKVVLVDIESEDNPLTFEQGEDIIERAYQIVQDEENEESDGEDEWEGFDENF